MFFQTLSCRPDNGHTPLLLSFIRSLPPVPGPVVRLQEEVYHATNSAIPNRCYLFTARIRQTPDLPSRSYPSVSPVPKPTRRFTCPLRGLPCGNLCMMKTVEPAEEKVFPAAGRQFVDRLLRKASVSLRNKSSDANCWRENSLHDVFRLFTGKKIGLRKAHQPEEVSDIYFGIRGREVVFVFFRIVK